MMGFLKKLRRNQRGNTLILTAAAMPLLIGSAGLATDTIQWALWKRQLQKAADSAAIAGVYARMAGQDAGVAVNYDVGYPSQPANAPNNNRTGYTLLNAPVVNTSLPNTADYINPVGVTLQIQQTLPFSSMFLSTTPTITANATAAAVETGVYCVISLEKSNTTGITAGGTTNVDFGCGMITNSISMDAAVAFGDSKVKATPVAAVGGLDSKDNWQKGTVLLPFTVAQQDPFKDIATPPIPSTCNDQIDDKPGDTTDYTKNGTAMGPVTKCLSKFSVQGNMTLQPGTYILTSDFSTGSKANLKCTGCTFILTNSDPSKVPQLKLDGNSTLNLKAPTSGTYSDILFFQDRNASNSTGNNVNGGSTSYFEGAFYFPNQEVTYNGNAGVSFNCVKLVARRVKFTGTSGLTNKCDDGRDQDRYKGRHVRLVA